MNQIPPERPVHTALDVTKPLFDAHGNLHHIIISSAFQLLTIYRGLFFVWDRRSGASLMNQGPHFRLSNEPLPRAAGCVRPTADDRLRMKQAAMVIDCLRRSSSAEVKGWSGHRRMDGTKRT